jgi:hypothetical protein
MIQGARELADERQDDLAREILRLCRTDGTGDLTNPAHVSAISTALAQIRRGEFASDEENQTVYCSFGR